MHLAQGITGVSTVSSVIQQTRPVFIHPPRSTALCVSHSASPLPPAPDASLGRHCCLSCCNTDMASKPAPWHGFTPHSLSAPFSPAFSYFLGLSSLTPLERSPHCPLRARGHHSCCLPEGQLESRNLRKAEVPKPECRCLSWSCG